MAANTATIGETIANMLSEGQRLGFCESYIWNTWVVRTNTIANYYKERGVCFYDPSITSDFLSVQEARYKAGEISDNYFKSVRITVRRLNEFYLTGTLRADATRKGTRYILGGRNVRLLELFISSHGYGENTRDDAAWIVRRYLHYFESQGHKSLETVTIEDVRQFILKTAAEVKPSTLHDIFLYLRHFHIYLKETGEKAPDCVELFSYKVYREMPIQGYVTDDELERILGVIDTSTETGKRNRAIILLAATTGLRACDIVRLKLTDIDWRKGELQLTQSKTGCLVYLPLMQETGLALQDYILNARPLSDCQEVFLRCSAPKTAITDASSIGTMFKDYEQRAGIERRAFDGKGFHGLRRRLAKKLLVTGTSLPVIAQILGHENIQSARQYLALDTNNLMECALDFSGIPTERRELQ